jgi:hypothetical protein
MLVFYYKLQHVSAVRISHHRVHVGYTKKKYECREASVYSGTNYNNIILKIGTVRLQALHNNFTEFLRYNQLETLI